MLKLNNYSTLLKNKFIVLDESTNNEALPAGKNCMFNIMLKS